MMKTWQYIMAAVLIVAAFFGGLIASCQYYKDNPEIKIKWLTETQTVYTAKPTIPAEYEYCYRSPLMIDAELVGKELNVTAKDDCKTATRKMQIDVVAPMRANMILLQPIISLGKGAEKSFAVGYGGLISYYHYWPVFRFEVGLGIGAGFMQKPAGGEFLISPGISVKF